MVPRYGCSRTIRNRLTATSSAIESASLPVLCGLIVRAGRPHDPPGDDDVAGVLQSTAQQELPLSG